MRYFLVSYHGMVVERCGERLIQTVITPHLSCDSLFALSISCDLSRASRFDSFLAASTKLEFEVEISEFGQLTIELDPVSLEASFRSFNDQYLCAEPAGQIVLNRMERMDWESFLVVTEDSVSQIQHILANRWVISSNRVIVEPSEIRIAEGPTMLIEDLRLPLKYNLPLEPRSFPFRIPVFKEGWRLDELRLYNPVAFFVAQGHDAVGQLLICLESLLVVGRFDGQILVYTDAQEIEIMKAVGKDFFGCLRVKKHPSQDWVGFVVGKYSILEEPEALMAAPLIYFDPDLIFNAPVFPMIADMVCASAATAPLEHFSKMANSPSVGGELLREDHACVSIASGFNAGTFAIPNVRDYGHIFELIRTLVMNYLHAHGRESLRWVDQEFANYVGYRLRSVDTKDITKYVRYGWQRDAEMLGPLSGLIHFCGIDRSRRVEPMRRYLDLVKTHVHRQG